MGFFNIRSSLDKKTFFIFQRFQLDKTSQADPLTLLEKISMNGISQDVCINDLGMNLQILELAILLFSFLKYDVIFLSFSILASSLGKPARKPLFVLNL